MAINYKPLFPGISVTGNATVKVGNNCSITEHELCQHESDGAVKSVLAPQCSEKHYISQYKCKKCGEFYR